MTNVIVEVAKEMISPVNKLIDAISKGIGILYEPHKIKKQAEAEAYAIKIIGQAISQNSAVPIVYNNHEINIDAKDYEELQKRACSRFVHQEVQRQFNIENIADKTYDMIKSEQAQTSEEVSKDWMNKFIAASQDVSDEDVQYIWSKILAGEILQPTSVSIKTLDVMKNLSKDDAQLFEKISHHVLEKEFLLKDKTFLNSIGISFEDILRLDDLGLINSSGYLAKTFKLNESKKIVVENCSYVLTAESKNSQEIKLPVYVLTISGRELLEALKISTDNDSFINSAKIIKKMFKNIIWELRKIKNYRDDTYTLEGDDLMAKDE